MTRLPTPPPCTALATRRFELPFDPPAALERLRDGHAPWLLESSLPVEGAGRFSFVGANPYLVMRAWGNEVEIECRRAVYGGLVRGRSRHSGTILDTLRSLTPCAPEIHCDLPFCGGAVGALGYEAAEQFDVHRLGGRNDLGLPDAVWLFVDALIGFDALEARAVVCGLGFGEDEPAARERAEQAAEDLLRKVSRSRPRRSGNAARDEMKKRAPTELETASYRKAFDEVREEIAAGEIYQACLTYRIDRPFRSEPWLLYRELRRRDPSPFAAYLELPELCVASSSPERFLRVGRDGEVESRPIKGTAPRGSEASEDARLRARLRDSEKDRAENLMIVDLVRNDFGRVCEAGSVSVPALFSVEPYASVFQLVSTVTGTLRRECDAFDAIAASFPPGSMTGAPKIAAMRILDRLESVRRGFYSGAMGYLDVRGGADLSVVIRTALVTGGRAYLHAGGGIVADSDPVAELEESRAKLTSLLAAVEACEEDAPEPTSA